MDPLSVLAVSAAVVQFVDFGGRLLSNASEIYQSQWGHTKSHVEIKALSENLAQMSDDIEKRSQKIKANELTESEEVFFSLCRECKGISSDLQACLLNLQARGTTRIERAGNSLVVSLKGIWSAKRVEDLVERLKEIRQQVMFSVLVFLWYVGDV